LLVAGFVAIGAAAFLHGSLLVSDPGGSLAAVRVAGRVTAACGCSAWGWRWVWPAPSASWLTPPPWPRR
jgi:hypothetical protein